MHYVSAMKDTTPSAPWKLTERDKIYLTRLVNYHAIVGVPEIWPIVAQHFGNNLALHAPHLKPPLKLTYNTLYQQIQAFAAGLQALGIADQPEEELPPRIALFADNSPRWLIADQGIMAAGAANAVRSSQAEQEELLFILADSGSQGLVVENQACLDRLVAKMGDQFSYGDAVRTLAFVILLSDETPNPSSGLKVLNFRQLMDLGSEYALRPVAYRRDRLATLIYTSGTTGKPKGVMLTHGNLLHQVNTFGTVVQPSVGDVVLSILPTWHSYGRMAEYCLLSQGCVQVYTNIRNIKKDFKIHSPHYMASVPRIWESIYESAQEQFESQPPRKRQFVFTCLDWSQKFIAARRLWLGLSLENLKPSLLTRVMAGLEALLHLPLHWLASQVVYQQVRAATGGQLKQVISGGGSLATHLDDFFEIVGVEVLVGYGLTETAPILTARRVWHNLRGSAGLPLPGTEIQIVDPETRQPLPLGQRGLVLARGPQVMQGYFQNPEATQKAIDPQGWFDTGDLGFLIAAGDLVLTGRAKDTIVLSNGENIEPQPIEDACIRSPYIQQIMLVGQDQKTLGALIVPNWEALRQYAQQQGLTLDLPSLGENASKTAWTEAELATLTQAPFQSLFRQELNREVQNRPGYRPDDRIAVFRLVPTAFSIDNGMMTQTLKIRRPVVKEHYQAMIDEMFH
jgi:long-chain acyl-CoA synthetase